MLNEHVARRGLMFALSSPSGAGKSTLARKLIEDDANMALSVSATTRPRAPERNRRPRIQVHGSARRSRKWPIAANFSNTRWCSAIITARRARRWKRC